jgi:hypothetical protein
MDDMPTWLQTVITILVTILASNGFWAFLQYRSNHKGTQAMILRAMAHDRIVYLGKLYIHDGYITQDEYENLYEMFEPYTKLGGNGGAKRIMKEVDKLPIRADSLTDHVETRHHE